MHTTVRSTIAIIGFTIWPETKSLNHTIKTVLQYFTLPTTYADVAIHSFVEPPADDLRNGLDSEC